MGGIRNITSHYLTFVYIENEIRNVFNLKLSFKSQITIQKQ